MSNSLYALTNEFTQIMDELTEMLEAGSITEEAFHDTLETLQMPLAEKVENTAKYVRNLEALAAAKEEEAKRLKESAASDKKKALNLLAGIDGNLKRAGIKHLQAGVFEAKYKKGSEIVQVDEKELPALFWTEEVVRKPMSKPELKKLIKARGQEIPGVKIVRNEDKLEIK